MATTTTTKVAEAISLLSDVLSAEVAASQHFLDDDEDETVALEDHEELKSLAEDFAGENYDGLEEVQSDLHAAVENEEDDDAYWPYVDGDDEDDDDDADEDTDESDDADDDDDETQPTDEEKMDMLIAAGDELQDKIDEHERTIEDLKNTIQLALDNIDTLVTAADTFRNQIEEY